jgi:hypothetical protein
MALPLARPEVGCGRLQLQIRAAVLVVLTAALLTGCGGGSGADPLASSPPPPPSDTTAPTLSAMAASAGAQDVTVTWTTDEAADSQVEYGTSTAYGSSSPLATMLVTSHSVSISGLAPATAYHYRVRSRDAAGNLAIGADASFTTTAVADTTPPTLAAISASTGTQTATITWTSDEPADSQVEFGTSTSYGASSNLAASLVTNHTVNLSALAPATLYHFRVMSRDAAGNLATSSDQTFSTASTPDTTSPTVTITAPAANATVSAIVSVTASAADNVGVSGVQFKLDGNPLGSEDTTSPYAVNWDTTTSANGTHSLTAVARDATGNQTVSAAVTVTVSNSAPPPGAAISVGQIVVDSPTLQTIGLSLPILSGDTNYNASVGVQYRRAGDTAWKDALPLLRVRPENLSWEDPTPFPVAEQFAGSIFDLTPDTDYEVQLTVQDPDGGGTTRSATIHTRPVPAADPASPRAVGVSTMSQLSSAIANAAPGDVITLANGTYAGAVTISRSGTAANPIFIRGQSRDGVILNASGATYGVTVTGNYVTVENLTIRSSSWGMRLNSTRNAVARRLHITDVSYGIDGRSGSKYDYYICDNLLEGKQAQWPTTDSSVWDYEGIVIVGQGHVVCYNTISGFGDALGLHHDTAIPNRAIDFYGNDVLWTGDNAIELDFSERNVRAFRNRFSNGGNQTMSFQPIWGGPAYAIRNVIYNSAVAPYKFNNEPSGIYVLHNTAVRPGWAWEQLGYTATNFIYENNITIGTTDAVNMTTAITLARIDYDGWLPDGQFMFGDLWTSFADLQAHSPYEQHGRILNGMPFATSLTIPASYTTQVPPLDPTLRAGSNAVDTGVALPNINDGWTGAGPDLGAAELGTPAPTYGVRP